MSEKLLYVEYNYVFECFMSKLYSLIVVFSIFLPSVAFSSTNPEDTQDRQLKKTNPCNLGPDLWAITLGHLHAQDMKNVQLTCSFFYEVSKKPTAQNGLLEEIVEGFSGSLSAHPDVVQFVRAFLQDRSVQDYKEDIRNLGSPSNLKVLKSRVFKIVKSLLIGHSEQEKSFLVIAHANRILDINGYVPAQKEMVSGLMRSSFSTELGAKLTLAEEKSRSKSLKGKFISAIAGIPNPTFMMLTKYWDELLLHEIFYVENLKLFESISAEKIEFLALNRSHFYASEDMKRHFDFYMKQIALCPSVDYLRIIVESKSVLFPSPSWDSYYNLGKLYKFSPEQLALLQQNTDILPWQGKRFDYMDLLSRGNNLEFLVKHKDKFCHNVLTGTQFFVLETLGNLEDSKTREFVTDNWQSMFSDDFTAYERHRIIKELVESIPVVQFDKVVQRFEKTMTYKQRLEVIKDYKKEDMPQKSCT